MYNNYSSFQRFQIDFTRRTKIPRSSNIIQDFQDYKILISKMYQDLLRFQDHTNDSRFQRLIEIPRCWSLFKIFKTHALTPNIFSKKNSKKHGVQIFDICRNNMLQKRFGFVLYYSKVLLHKNNGSKVPNLIEIRKPQTMQWISRK